MKNIQLVLLSINKNNTKAGVIAILILAFVVVFCAAALILKKLQLNKKYKMDEEVIKSYNNKLKEIEKKNANKVGEDI